MSLNVIEPGWLYVIANPAMPRACKVGMTTRTPEERAAELHDTGSPAPYHVVAKWQVADVRGAERDAHAALAAFRTQTGREWFALPADRAVRAVDQMRGARVRPTIMRRLWRVVRGAVEGVGWLTLALLFIAS